MDFDFSKTHVTKEYIDEMIKASKDAKDLRYMYIDKIKNKEISIDDYIELSKQKKFSALQSARILDVVCQVNDISRQEAAQVLIDNHIYIRRKMKAVINDEILKTKLENALRNKRSILFDLEPKAPLGWPWYGNITDTIKELDSVGDDLDREILYYGYGEFEKDIHTGLSRFKSSKEHLLGNAFADKDSDRYDYKDSPNNFIDEDEEDEQDDLMNFLGANSDDDKSDTPDDTGGTDSLESYLDSDDDDDEGPDDYYNLLG